MIIILQYSLISAQLRASNYGVLNDNSYSVQQPRVHIVIEYY